MNTSYRQVILDALTKAMAPVVSDDDFRTIRHMLIAGGMPVSPVE